MKKTHSLLLGLISAVLLAAALPAQAEWSERAELTQERLHGKFWDDDASRFLTGYPEDGDHWHYWWQAHALDVLIDAYERTGDEAFLERAGALYEGVLEVNDGITNDFYDDMLWMALALLRLHDITGDETYREAIDELWQDIQTGWNDHYGGGIAWEKNQLDYKNTPSNAPAVILAARLYQTFGEEEDLEWAKRIYTWLQDTLIDPDTGFAWDGINRQGDGEIDKNWAFTYNQGTYIGAALELYRVTGEEEYREEAFRTAAATVDRLVDDETGIFTESGSGDGGLFKGILVRYMTDLIQAFPDQTAQYRELLLKNADTLWSQTRETEPLLFAADWSETGEAPLDLSVQLSGLKLIEHAAQLTD